MKLLKTITKIIEESERQLNSVCESCVSLEELDRLEQNYNNSLKLLDLYQSKEKKKLFKKQYYSIIDYKYLKLVYYLYNE